MSEERNGDDNAIIVLHPPPALRGEVRFDPRLLSFDHDLNEVEQRAFDRCYQAMLWATPTKRRYVSSFVRGLVLQYPKIAKVRKDSYHLLGDVIGMLRGNGSPEVIDLIKVLLEKNPNAALFWHSDKSDVWCLMVMIETPLIHLWLAENLPSVLECSCQIYQEDRGGIDVYGLSPSKAILDQYCCDKTVSASQLLQYFDNFPQSLDQNIYEADESTMVPILYFVRHIYLWGSDDERWDDEHFEVLKCMASKRPELLCTGEVSVVLTAMHWTNDREERHGSQDKACSLIKILVRACPVSILTEGRYHYRVLNRLRPPMTPFDLLQSSDSHILPAIREDLKPFFARTKQCLDRKAALEADLSFFRKVFDTVQSHSIQGDYQAWILASITNLEEELKYVNVFKPLL